MSDRRIRRRDQTRRALLDAALALFAERGLYATRVEDVTERIDLGKGAFYNYFESKDALVAALVAEAVEQLAEHVRGRRNGAASPAELARLHQQFFDSHPHYLLLVHQARGLLQLKPDASPRLREVFREYLACLAGIFIPRVPDADASDDELAVAAAIAGTLTGTTSFRLAAGLSSQAEDLSRELVAHGLPPIVARIHRPAPGCSTTAEESEPQG